MQISDLMNQYRNIGGNKNGKTESMKGTKGVHKLVSSLRDMSAGNIFEGTVNSVKGGKVVLGLSNGQTVTARLDAKISLTQGQSMFFQVKSNDGAQIAIRPYTINGNAVNLTLMSALEAAGLPIDGRHLSMVNSMMQEQMPIDVDSLHQMARLLANNEGISVQTLVEMSKLELPINEQIAAQFENYLDDKQAIGKAMEGFMDELPQALSNEDMALHEIKQINSEVLKILTEDLPEGNGTFMAQTVDENGHPIAQMGGGNGNPIPQLVDESGNPIPQTVDENGNPVPQTVDENGNPLPVNISENEVGNSGNVAGSRTLVLQTQISEHTAASLLDKNQMRELSEQLKSLPGLAENTRIFEGGQLKPQSSAVEILRAVQQALQHPQLTDKSAITKLFSSEGMARLMKDSMEQQWLIKPEQLENGDKINKLYERLDSQISRMETVVKTAGMENTALNHAAADVRGNVDFMNHINQTYTYVQIPLKMNGQNASGELFVYTNKKNLAKDKDKELTAFLHLDLDNLGSTDVSVKMSGKKVDTNFYLDDDASFELIQAHLPELEKRLEKKGYQCRLTVNHENRHVNFVEDFLKKDQPAAGQLHRYSFDMRA